MFKIQTGVPLPSNRVNSDRRGRKRIYPFPEMKPGDSFRMPKSKISSVQVCANKYGHQHGMEFTTRRDGHGLRIWRVK